MIEVTADERKRALAAGRQHSRKALPQHVGLGIACQGLQEQQQFSRLSGHRPNGTGGAHSRPRLLVGQQANHFEEGVRVARADQAQRAIAAELRRGIHRRAVRGFHLHVAHALEIHIRRIVVHGIERGDNGGDGGAALVQLRRVGHQAMERRRKIGDKLDDAEVAGDLGGLSGHQVRAV